MTVTLCMKYNCSSCGSCSENNTNVVYHVACKKIFFVMVVSHIVLFLNSGTVIDVAVHFFDIIYILSDHW